MFSNQGSAYHRWGIRQKSWIKHIIIFKCHEQFQTSLEIKREIFVRQLEILKNVFFLVCKRFYRYGSLGIRKHYFLELLNQRNTCSVATTMSQMGGCLRYFFVTCIDISSCTHNMLLEIVYGLSTSFDFVCRSSSGQLYKIKNINRHQVSCGRRPQPCYIKNILKIQWKLYTMYKCTVNCKGPKDIINELFD